MLRDGGYATGGFVDGGYMNRAFGLGQGFDHYDARGGGLAAIGPKALAWLGDHRGRPFFLFVHTYDVHTPYAPPEPYRSTFLAGLAPPTPGFEPSSERMEAIRHSGWKGEAVKLLPPNDLAYALALYDAGIRYVDDWLATLRRRLVGLGLDRRVILVVVSDHGEEFLEHGSVLHEKLYGTVTHVPLILRLPGPPAPRVVPNVVGAIDLMPTLLELTVGRVPKTLQGRSLAPYLDGRTVEPRAEFSESMYFGDGRGVFLGRYHLLFALRTGATQLFDLQDDPLEQRDLAAASPERVRELRGALRGWAELVDAAPPLGRTESRVDAETGAQLRALGYLQ